MMSRTVSGWVRNINKEIQNMRAEIYERVEAIKQSLALLRRSL